LEGTAAMRNAAETYLPRHENETNTQYQERLQGNVLYNMTDITLRTWVGKPFASSIQFTEDFPNHLKPLMDDVDRMGNNLDVFGRSWFKAGMADAFSHVLVDYPRPTFYPGRNAKSDHDEGVRPYLVHIPAQNVIFACSERENGREVLTHVRIREWEISVDGWEEVVQERIRVLDLEWIYPDSESNDLTEPIRVVRVTIWIYDEEDKKWVEDSSFYMDIDFIPLVTFYADRTGFMTGKSPLLDLTDINIRHWQSMSDQIAILTVARFPLLACSGGSSEEGEKLVIGPKEWLFCDDPTGKFYYVEHKGAAIAAGEKDISKLEERMMVYGAEHMKRKPDRQTASARNLDSSEATSPLQDIVYRFNDALNTVLAVMSYWMNKTYVGKAFLPTDFTSPEASTLQALYDTWKEGGLGTDQYLKELQRRDVLDEHFDFDANRKAVTARAKEITDAAEKPVVLE
ncbi:MAG: DUF4055 domain-containing protein, partial [Candidatus Peribacteraceae bacterium]|nr:DUF4055 domain-containing protein [Candidatus Peribacteraceae bacterium]